WDRARAELASVPLSPRIIRIPEKDTPTGLFYRVELPAVENTTIVGWYYVPRDAFDTNDKVLKKCPAIIIMPGHGAEEPPLDRTTSGIITLSLNPRNHGPSKEFWQSPVDHLLYTIADPEHYYYKLAVLDCLRGADFLFSREEVDSTRVAAEGGSQGGYFAVAVAALDHRIACAVSNVTAFSDYRDGVILGITGHHSQFRKLLWETMDQTPRIVVPQMIWEAKENTSGTLIRKSLAYTDGANLATRVRCPIQFNMGDQDPVCNAICGVVTYNKVPDGIAKEFNLLPDTKHEVPPSMREHNWRWLKKFLRLEQPNSATGFRIPNQAP
ncbi:MAG: acetylxylan esterase, partial [bacterium]